MALHPSALILLTPNEQQSFFGGPSGGMERLRRLLPAARLLSPLEPAERLRAELAATPPEILVTGWTDVALPEDLPTLRYVCHLGGRVRGVVSRGMIERGLVVSNWGEAVSETVAEMALFLVLSALRRSHHFADLMHRRGGWALIPSGLQSLFDRRVGIHGFGAAVRHLLPLLRPFRPRLEIYSAGVPSEMFARHEVTRSPSLEALFARSDVLIELEALTPLTRGTVSAAVLELLPPGATFVNLGRGAVVDEDALIRLAQSGRIRAALDVYRQEPLPEDSPLRGLNEVVLFPHVGGPTDDCIHRCGDHALRNLERYLSGQPVESQVTLEVFDRAT